ncbi:MAG: hypothetical protein SP1CHLAM54_06390 [Chlamydiia bacterium]|nr:hypothetical protein [Chlamydiia bacterium]MCH9615549.1 hypothetical protein [Chlamydiia bacterium]MCH9629204.1 hypothetical protein [Chlamydiia bacterium]
MEPCGFSSIWVKPKQTLRRIVESAPNAKLWLLSAVYGLHYMFWLGKFFSFSNTLPLWGTIVLAVVLAIPVGYIAFNITAWFIWWIGKLLGGHAPFTHVRAVVAWSNFPNIINIIVWIVLMSAFGSSVFAQGFPGNIHPEGGMLRLLQICMVVQLIISIWILVIMVNGLGEVSMYSVWMGLLNVILASIIIGLLFYGGAYLLDHMMQSGGTKS